MRCEGKILFAKKNYGFIRCEGVEKDIYFDPSKYSDRFYSGEKISFELRELSGDSAIRKTDLYAENIIKQIELYTSANGEKLKIIRVNIIQFSNDELNKDLFNFNMILNRVDMGRKVVNITTDKRDNNFDTTILISNAELTKNEIDYLVENKFNNFARGDNKMFKIKYDVME